MENHRGKHIGLKLMEEGLQRIKKEGASEMYLEVRVSNRPAIEMYRKLGFKIGKSLEGYYRDGEDAYMMVSDLSGPERAKENAAM
jgi:ribosomal-protein-alanine N-acetyltransferase